MTAFPHEALTQAEFPAWEQRQSSKHEFVNGHVYGFAGGTFAHADLAGGLLERIRPHVRPWRAIGSDLLVEMAASSRYADVVVTCDERDFDPAGTANDRFEKALGADSPPRKRSHLIEYLRLLLQR